MLFLPDNWPSFLTASTFNRSFIFYLLVCVFIEKSNSNVDTIESENTINPIYKAITSAKTRLKPQRKRAIRRSMRKSDSARRAGFVFNGQYRGIFQTAPRRRQLVDSALFVWQGSLWRVMYFYKCRVQPAENRADNSIACGTGRRRNSVGTHIGVGEEGAARRIGRERLIRYRTPGPLVLRPPPDAYLKVGQIALL
ncbi:hypothetical protein X948_3004 [Burkholderia pseudomallei MSHR5608]|nr:hypothetical protein X948_3004 [Burkholderia pseudomallei MSHR5608]